MYLLSGAEVFCPEPSNPFSHGSFRVYQFKRQTVDYECHVGFQLVGSSRQICGDDRQWHPLERPYCIPAKGETPYCLQWVVNVGAILMNETLNVNQNIVLRS